MSLFNPKTPEERRRAARMIQLLGQAAPVVGGVAGTGIGAGIGAALGGPAGAGAGAAIGGGLGSSVGALGQLASVVGADQLTADDEERERKRQEAALAKQRQMDNMIRILGTA